jgi:hypothetical protein
VGDFELIIAKQEICQKKIEQGAAPLELKQAGLLRS